DGIHAARRPVQSWTTDMGAVAHCRTRPPVPARSMKAPVICLMGPTAAGKSAATLALARRWSGEVINVDSATIYRGMDIGTAKPGPAERAAVPQHLLDIRDPAES